MIAFTGLKGSAKTTAALYLEEQHGYKRINFKDSLIDELESNFPKLLDELSLLYGIKKGELFIEKPILVRRLIQEYGTDVRRKDDKNYWVKRWKEKVISSGYERIVVDDVRFLNEAEAVNDLGGTIIEIARDNIYDGDTHISETEMRMITPSVKIFNDKDINSLYNKLEELNL